MKKVMMLVLLLLVSFIALSMGPNTSYEEYRNMKNGTYGIADITEVPEVNLGQAGSFEYVRRGNSSVDTIDLDYFGAIATEDEYTRGLAILTQDKPITGQAGLEHYLAFGRCSFGYNLDGTQDYLLLAGQ